MIRLARTSGAGQRPLVKIYGERNTGTNYLSELLRHNLDVEELPGVVPHFLGHLPFSMGERIRDLYFRLTFQDNLGWKHARVKESAILRQYGVTRGNLLFLTITKNPYSWLLSMYRRPYHRATGRLPDFESFIAQPWRSVGRDNTARVLPSPVELWNLKNASYLALSDAFNCLTLRYEELLADPARVVEAAAAACGAPWKVRRFENHELSTKETGKRSEDYREYYLNERWKPEITARAIDLISDRLDNRVLGRFGYEKLKA